MKYELRETRQFKKWLNRVDRKVRVSVVVRLARLEKGNLGDYSSVGGGVSELRFHSGKGARGFIIPSRARQLSSYLLVVTSRARRMTLKQQRRW